MRYIGFKNFRRFEELKPIQLAPISIFVGGNNSGKSTVVKGLLTILGFMKDECDYEYFNDGDETDEPRMRQNARRVSHNQRFRFNKDYYAHIGTSQRALRRGAHPKDITFQLGMGNQAYEVIVNIDDESEDSTSGRVTNINYSSLSDRYEVKFDLLQWRAEIIFHTDDPRKYILDSGKTASESEKESYAKKYQYFSSFNKDFTLPIKLPEILRDFSDSLIDHLFRAVEITLNESMSGPDVSEEANDISSLERDFRRPYFKDIQRIVISDEIRQLLTLGPCWSYRKEFRFRVFRSLESVEYIYAHAVTQSVIYSAKDTNDYLVKTVNDFANCRITHSTRGKKGELYQFIKNWMGLFGIGMDFTVKSIGGEAHIVKIKNMNGDLVNLADMGMGSIQLMILLFRIASILDHSSMRSTIILEEPEQNLHPMLQSKLADMFLDIFEKFGLSFIVETHSEYLIRKTQVIVGERYNTQELLSKNPFRVYYFPTHGDPYDMEYTPSGKFAQPFGEGFFDEAANLHMMVLKNSRK